MREIKFKAKRKDNNEWVYGNLVYIKWCNEYYIIDFNTNIYNENEFGDIKELDIVEVIPSTISQYTGLKVKNGVEIYENDIVKAFFDFPFGEEIIVGQVIFKIFGGLKIKVKNKNGWLEETLYPFEMLENIEVIGNIYDKEVK